MKRKNLNIEDPRSFAEKVPPLLTYRRYKFLFSKDLQEKVNIFLNLQSMENQLVKKGKNKFYSSKSSTYSRKSIEKDILKELEVMRHKSTFKRKKEAATINLKPKRNTKFL